MGLAAKLNALTPAQKMVLKNCFGEFTGTLAQYKQAGQYHPNAINTYDPTGLMKTEKTSRTCRLCRGEKVVAAVFSHMGGLVVKRPCTQCGGTGKVFG